MLFYMNKTKRPGQIIHWVHTFDKTKIFDHFVPLIANFKTISLRCVLAHLSRSLIRRAFMISMPPLSIRLSIVVVNNFQRYEVLVKEMFKNDGQQKTDVGRTLEDAHTISSPCETNESVELKLKKTESAYKPVYSALYSFRYFSQLTKLKFCTPLQGIKLNFKHNTNQCKCIQDHYIFISRGDNFNNSIPKA